MDAKVEPAVQQYIEAVELFVSETVQERTSADVQTDFEQNSDYQVAEDAATHTPLETMDPGELDWEARALFFWREDGTVTTSDSVTESQTVGEESAYADLLEKSFLSGLQDDTESDIILDEKQTETTDPSPKPLTEQERRAMLGTLLLDHGGMPRLEYLAAMGMDDAKARGLQSLVWLSTENDPIARRKVEAMIDSTSPEAQVNMTEKTEVVDRRQIYEAGRSQEGKDGKTRIISSNLGNLIDVTPSQIHSIVNKNPGYKGVPNSSVDILDLSGDIATRRWYDSTGRAHRDVDMTNHGNPAMHLEWPHEHIWIYGEDGRPTRQ